MKKQTYPIPEGCKAISMEIIDNAIVTTFEQPEFKKGDILYFSDHDGEYGGIFIFDKNIEDGKKYFVFLSENNKSLIFDSRVAFDFKEKRLATDTETQLLFDALAKENKAWDAEKMEIVELKYIPKVGDCVKIKYKNSQDYFGYVIEVTDNRCICDNIENEYFYKAGNFYFFDCTFTKITTSELQAEFNKIGYEYDFETHEAKKLRWKPIGGELYFFVTAQIKIEDDVWHAYEYDNNRFNGGNCFKTEAEAQKFKDYILKYEAQNN